MALGWSSFPITLSQLSVMTGHYQGEVSTALSMQLSKSIIRPGSSREIMEKKIKRQDDDSFWCVYMLSRILSTLIKRQHQYSRFQFLCAGWKENVYISLPHKLRCELKFNST